MDDEIKKTQAEARAKALVGSFGGRSIAEAALAASGNGTLLRAIAARAANSPSASVAALAAQAQRLTAVDAQLRSMSIAGSGTTKQVAEAQRVADSGFANALSDARAEMSGSSQVLRAIERFREGFAAKAALSSSLARAVEELDRSTFGSLSATHASISSFVSMHEAAARSVSRIAAGAKSLDHQAIERITKSFDQFGKLASTREIRSTSASLFAEARESARYLDSIRLPLIDSASAAAIARVWGEEGVNRQLRALGIEAGPHGLAEGHATDKLGKRIEVLPILRDAFTLLSLLFALYQWWDSELTEARIIGAIREDRAEREKQMEAVKALISAALAQQAAREEMRFICRTRVAAIHSAPRSGSSRIGSVFPNQVVKPITEIGKWIQIEYYDFLAQESRTGWALKKYFTRIPPPIAN